MGSNGKKDSVQISLRISSSLLERIGEMEAIQGVTRSEFINDAIKNYLWQCEDREYRREQRLVK